MIGGLIDFVSKGGPVAYFVVVLGLVGLAIEIARFFRWIGQKRIPEEGMAAHTNTPVFFGGAALCAGVFGTALELYRPINADTIFARLSPVIFANALVSVMIGAVLASLIMLAHALLLSLLRSEVR